VVVQRLFSAFPDGRPGLGLLLLRAVVGLTAAVQGAVFLTAAGPHPLGAWIAGGLATAGGMTVLIGFLTPGTGACVGVSIALLWYRVPPPSVSLDGVTALIIVADSAAIALLGPGAFSVDARLFGRREIRIPHERHVPKS
jgi:putative oxidoreductase